jgi:hypothetical protein
MFESAQADFVYVEVISIAERSQGISNPERIWYRSRNPALLLELEAIILRATEPPYNVQIPTERWSYASQTSELSLADAEIILERLPIELVPL